MHLKKEIGDKGEALACELLVSKGYEILETNWRFQKAEVDLILKKDSMLVFVEVKTRSTNQFGEPESFVDTRKQSHLVRAAEGYLEELEDEPEVRFDIVSIIASNGKSSILHLEDAFRG